MNALRRILYLASFIMGTSVFSQPILTVDRSAPPDVQWAWALYQGDVGWVEELIAKGYKVNKRLGEIKHHQSGTELLGSGLYPIQVAVRGGGPELIKFLARQGAKLDVKTSDGQSLIHLAYDRPRAVSTLLELKANPLAQDKQGNTVLHTAVGDGSKLYEEQEAIVQLLKENKKLLSVKNKAGKTAVEQAMNHGNRRAVELLAAERLPELEKKIAQATANLEAEQKKKSEQLAHLDLSTCGQPARLTTSDILIKAVNSNDRKLLDCVLKKKPTLANYRTCANEYTYCETKPHVVFEFSSEELIEAVIDGSSKEYLDADSYLGNTVTALLFRSGGKTIWFRKLRDKGVRLNVKNHFGKTPQTLACEKGSDELIALLGPDAHSGAYKVGQKVWIQGLTEAAVLRSCSHGAILSYDGKKTFVAANSIRTQPQAFLTQKKASGDGRANLSEQDTRYEANYRKHKQKIDLMRNEMARLAPKIISVENEMASLGWTPPQYEKSSVTGYQCDVNQQNCRTTTQGGGGETVLSQWRRIDNRDKLRMLESKRMELVLRYNSLAREHDELLAGKK